MKLKEHKKLKYKGASGKPCRYKGKHFVLFGAGRFI